MAGERWITSGARRLKERMKKQEQRRHGGGGGRRRSTADVFVHQEAYQRPQPQSDAINLVHPRKSRHVEQAHYSIGSTYPAHAHPICRRGVVPPPVLPYAPPVIDPGPAATTTGTAPYRRSIRNLNSAPHASNHVRYATQQYATPAALRQGRPLPAATAAHGWPPPTFYGGAPPWAPEYAPPRQPESFQYGHPNADENYPYDEHLPHETRYDVPMQQHAAEQHYQYDGSGDHGSFESAWGSTNHGNRSASASFDVAWGNGRGPPPLSLSDRRPHGHAAPYYHMPPPPLFSSSQAAQSRAPMPVYEEGPESCMGSYLAPQHHRNDSFFNANGIDTANEFAQPVPGNASERLTPIRNNRSSFSSHGELDELYQPDQDTGPTGPLFGNRTAMFVGQRAAPWNQGDTHAHVAPPFATRTSRPVGPMANRRRQRAQSLSAYDTVDLQDHDRRQADDTALALPLMEPTMSQHKRRFDAVRNANGPMAQQQKRRYLSEGHETADDMEFTEAAPSNSWDHSQVQPAQGFERFRHRHAPQTETKHSSPTEIKQQPQQEKSSCQAPTEHPNHPRTSQPRHYQLGADTAATSADPRPSSAPAEMQPSSLASLVAEKIAEPRPSGPHREQLQGERPTRPPPEPSGIGNPYQRQTPLDPSESTSLLVPAQIEIRQSDGEKGPAAVHRVQQLAQTGSSDARATKGDHHVTAHKTFNIYGLDEDENCRSKASSDIGHAMAPEHTVNLHATPPKHIRIFNNGTECNLRGEPLSALSENSV